MKHKRELSSILNEKLGLNSTDYILKILIKFEEQKRDINLNFSNKPILHITAIHNITGIEESLYFKSIHLAKSANPNYKHFQVMGIAALKPRRQITSHKKTKKQNSTLSYVTARERTIAKYK